jgi:hypothetical protein
VVLALAGQGGQPRYGAEVLLHVPAGHHFLGEELIERHAAGKNGDILVVEPVRQHHEAQGDGLFGDGFHVLPDDALDAVQELADRLYDKDVPILASGVPFDQLFTEEMMTGGYMKKYFRAVSRLTAK